MSENVAFLIIKQPYQSLDSGVYMNYNLVMRLEYNYAFWSDATNTFAHGLLRKPELERQSRYV